MFHSGQNTREVQLIFNKKNQRQNVCLPARTLKQKNSATDIATYLTSTYDPPQLKESEVDPGCITQEAKIPLRG